MDEPGERWNPFSQSAACTTCAKTADPILVGVGEGHVMLAVKMDKMHDDLKLELQLDRGENRSAIRRLRERLETVG